MPSSDDWQRLGDLVRPPEGPLSSPQRLIAEVWREAVGEEIARNARPLSFRGGKLIVSTSSAVWAQTLQLMAERLRKSLNALLGQELVEEIACRPAGWDPGGGADGPRGLGRRWRAERVPSKESPAEPHQPEPVHSLTEEEKQAVAEVQQLACDPDLGDLIARAMKATLVRQKERDQPP